MLFTANFKVSYEEWAIKKYDPFFNINNREDLNIAKKLIIIKIKRSWRNWYTRNVEVVVEETPWRFKSSRPHQF